MLTPCCALPHRLVGGADVLRAMEVVPVDDDNRPKDAIKIISTPVRLHVALACMQVGIGMTRGVAGVSRSV